MFYRIVAFFTRKIPSSFVRIDDMINVSFSSIKLLSTFFAFKAATFLLLYWKVHICTHMITLSLLIGKSCSTTMTIQRSGISIHFGMKSTVFVPHMFFDIFNARYHCPAIITLKFSIGIGIFLSFDLFGLDKFQVTFRNFDL